MWWLCATLLSQNKNTSLSCIINESGSSAIFSSLLRVEKKMCVRPSLLLTSDFNYWPGKGGSPTHFFLHTHTHKQWWVISGQAFIVHSHQCGGQWGVSWIIDELESGSRQIYIALALHPACLPGCLIFLSVCDSVPVLEELPVWGDTFLQHNWEGMRQRQR